MKKPSKFSKFSNKNRDSRKERPEPNAPKEDRRKPRFSKQLVVLYEDDALIVLDKPAGLLAVPITGSSAPSALSLLIEHLKPIRQRAMIVHRIDRFSSGALVFAKTRPDREVLIRQKKNDQRSEEHTSELQSHVNLVCRLLLEKKK